MSQFKVGQVWQRRNGEEVTIAQIWPDQFTYPIRIADARGDVPPELSLTKDGREYDDGDDRPLDLVRLVRDVGNPEPMYQQFSKIVVASDGREVLFYIEPRNGFCTVHKIACDKSGKYQFDLPTKYNLFDFSENERRARDELMRADQNAADRALRGIDTYLAEKIAANEGKRDVILETTGHSRDDVARSMYVIQAVCHGMAKSAGWWNQDDPYTSKANPMHFSNKLCLIHSEISESMEGDRKKLMDDKLPHRPMREVELGDALIRIGDLGGGYEMDLAGAVVEKLEYNASRSDHKPENRKAEGGKAY